MIKIGILQTGPVPNELVRRHGEYPAMVADWLSDFDAEFQSYAVLENEFPDHATDCDLWVITGSRFGVYDGQFWMALLEEFIRSCKSEGRKMIGICFGHQIIAQALGGVVEKSDRGWGLGVHEYETFGWPGYGPTDGPDLRIQAYHQDQIVQLPPDVNVIARSEFCAYAALWYPGFALTVQGHPEMPAIYANDLLEIRRGTVLTQKQVADAKLTTDAATTRRQLATYIREHLADI